MSSRIISDATADFCPSLPQELTRIKISSMTVTVDDAQYLGFSSGMSGCVNNARIPLDGPVQML